MKRIIKYLLILVIGGAFFTACEQPESNWNTMTNDYNKSNTTYYVQFMQSSGNFQTAIDDNGAPENIVQPIAVSLLGAPQASDVTVTTVKE